MIGFHMNKLDKENYEISCLFDWAENVQDLQRVQNFGGASTVIP